jgi:hypothetical protein
VSTNRIYERVKEFKYKKEILLAPIIIIAFFLTYYPHINYQFLLHVDEWYHVAQAKQIALNSNIDWFTGTKFTPGMEQAWHTILAGIYVIFKPKIMHLIFIPAILHIFGVISVYIFCNRFIGKNEALISSLLIAILPSNVTMGGPVFLIPLNLSLIFIPLGLVFAFNLTKIKPLYNYTMLCLIITFLLYSHPPTSLVFLIILVFYVILKLLSKQNGDKRIALNTILSIFFSILLSIPNFMFQIAQRGISTFTFDFWVNISGIPVLYGIIPTFFFIIGFYFFIKMNRKENLSLILTAFILIINILIFSIIGTNYFLPYARTHIPLLLIMSIIAGYGYLKVWGFFKSKKKIGSVIIVLLLIITTSISIHQNINTDYYQIIDLEDYTNFLWIKENTPNNVTILSDPWKARALATIAERRVYAVMPFGPDEDQLKVVDSAVNFLQKNCSDTLFLIRNNISVVYTKNNCQNQHLVELTDNIYFLKK